MARQWSIPAPTRSSCGVKRKRKIPNPKPQTPNPKSQIPNPKPRRAIGPRTEDQGRTDRGRTKDQGLSREHRKRIEAERKKKQRSIETLQKRIADLEARIADKEARVKELEAAMSAPGFYDDRDASKLLVDQHQALMWEVGDLMSQWEALQSHAAEQATGAETARSAES